MPFISSIRRNHEQENTKPEHLEITGGDVVYTAGGYRIHMLTSVGEAELSIKNLATGKSGALNLQTDSINIEYLIVGGGGGGGTRHGGGGGAGGMIIGNSAFATGNVPVVVGDGGPRRTGDATGFNGQNSTFSSAVALGGGGGGNWGPSPAANPGGSGGGSGGPSSTGASNSNFGTGQQPLTTPLNGVGFGFPGGRQDRFPGPGIRSGGGGGAGRKGEDGSEPGGANIAGVGGPGIQNSILGTNYYWAGGGGGTGWDQSRGAPGGLGGGGGGTRGTPGGLGGTGGLNDGQDAQPAPGDNAFRQGGDAGANTGSGGGGGLQVPSTGGAGGSGIVAVRYRI